MLSIADGTSVLTFCQGRATKEENRVTAPFYGGPVELYVSTQVALCVFGGGGSDAQSLFSKGFLLYLPGRGD